MASGNPLFPLVPGTTITPIPNSIGADEIKDSEKTEIREKLEVPSLGDLELRAEKDFSNVSPPIGRLALSLGNLATKNAVATSDIGAGSVTLAKLDAEVTAAFSGGLNPALFLGNITSLSAPLADATASSGKWYFANVAGTLSGTNSGQVSGGDVDVGGYLLSNGTNWLVRKPAPTVIADDSLTDAKLDSDLKERGNAEFADYTGFAMIWRNSAGKTLGAVRADGRWLIDLIGITQHDDRLTLDGYLEGDGFKIRTVEGFTGYGFVIVNESDEIVGGTYADGSALLFEIAAPPKISIGAIGDSLTDGQGAQPDESFPIRLAELLGVPVQNYGNPGAKSTQIAVNFTTLAKHEDVVVFCMGRNNLGYQDPDFVETVCLNIRECVADLPVAAKFLVVTPPLANQSGERIGETWALKLADLTARLSATYGPRVLDLNSAMVAALHTDLGIKLAASFTQPAVNSNVQVTLASTTALSTSATLPTNGTYAPKQVALGWAAGPDFYEVVSVDSSTLATLKLISANDVAPGGTVANVSETLGGNPSTAATRYRRLWQREDLKNYADNVPPVSLRFDTLHFNAAGYVIFARLIAERIAALNWI